MAWQVYDAFEGGYSPERRGTVYGPLPCKRWVPDGKPYRLQHKVKVARGDSLSADAKRTADGLRAVQYARWLAERDGITIPDDCAGMPIWDSVVVPDLKRPEPRIRAVQWVRHATKKHVDPREIRVVIKIPNWDWVPVAIEETEMEFRLAAY